MLTMLFASAEFERNMIIERTEVGKRIARLNPDFKDGKPKKFTRAQIGHARSLLSHHSHAQISRLTGISLCTLQ